MIMIDCSSDTATDDDRWRAIPRGWTMDPFSFASSEALEIPLNVRMSVWNLVKLHLA